MERSTMPTSLSSLPTTSALKGEAGSIANVILVTVTSLLSLFGTVFVISSYFAWKDVQTTSRKILLFISLADFFTCCGTILGLWSGTNDNVCFVQSVIGTFSVICSFFWTVFMAVYLYVSIARKNMSTAQCLMPVFHVFGWGVPTVIVIAASSTRALGNNDDVVSSGWCWVNTALRWRTQVVWMLFAGKLWEIAASVAITVLYFLMKMNLKKQLALEKRLLTESTVATAHRADKKLMVIPLLFVVFRSWGTIRFFIFVADGPDHEPTNHLWLMLMQAVGDNAQGFTNFLVYCFFTDKVWGKLKAACGALCASFSPRCCCFTGDKQDQSTARKGTGEKSLRDVEASDWPVSNPRTIHNYGSV